MTSFATPTDVRFDYTLMWVSLSDGRILGVPLSWFPLLLEATPEQRRKFWLSPQGLHWEEIDEDISVQGLIEGRGDMTNRRPKSTSAAAE
jgi:hypothetical protein